MSSNISSESSSSKDTSSDKKKKKKKKKKKMKKKKKKNISISKSLVFKPKHQIITSSSEVASCSPSIWTGELEIIAEDGISSIERQGGFKLLKKIVNLYAPYEFKEVKAFYAACLRAIELGKKS